MRKCCVVSCRFSAFKIATLHLDSALGPNRFTLTVLADGIESSSGGAMLENQTYSLIVLPGDSVDQSGSATAVYSVDGFDATFVRNRQAGFLFDGDEVSILDGSYLGYQARADFNGDGTVDGTDATAVRDRFVSFVFVVPPTDDLVLSGNSSPEGEPNSSPAGELIASPEKELDERHSQVQNPVTATDDTRADAPLAQIALVTPSQSSIGPFSSSKTRELVADADFAPLLDNGGRQRKVLNRVADSNDRRSIIDRRVDHWGDKKHTDRVDRVFSVLGGDLKPSLQEHPSLNELPSDRKLLRKRS